MPNFKKLLGDLVLLKEIKQDNLITVKGVTMKSKSEPIAEVIDAGSGRYEFGSLVPMSVNKGDKVIFVPGDTIVVDNEEYYLVSEKHIRIIL